jgi:hypothetical protein
LAAAPLRPLQNINNNKKMGRRRGKNIALPAAPCLYASHQIRMNRIFCAWDLSSTLRICPPLSAAPVFCAGSFTSRLSRWSSFDANSAKQPTLLARLPADTRRHAAATKLIDSLTDQTGQNEEIKLISNPSGGESAPEFLCGLLHLSSGLTSADHIDINSDSGNMAEETRPPLPPARG